MMISQGLQTVSAPKLATQKYISTQNRTTVNPIINGISESHLTV